MQKETMLRPPHHCCIREKPLYRNIKQFLAECTKSLTRILISSVSGAEKKREELFAAIDNIRASRDRSTTGAVEAFELAKDRLFTTSAGSHPNEIRVS